MPPESLVFAPILIQVDLVLLDYLHVATKLENYVLAGAEVVVFLSAFFHLFIFMLQIYQLHTMFVAPTSRLSVLRK